MAHYFVSNRVGKRSSEAPLALIVPKIAIRFPKLTGFDFIKEALGKFREVAMKHVKKHQDEINYDDHPRDFIDAYLKEIKATTEPSSSFYDKAGSKFV